MNAVAAGSSSTTMRRPGRNWPPRSGRCDHISRYCRGAGARAPGDGWHAEFWSMKRSSQMPASNGATAADAGTVDVGGDLTVNRLGFGAMRVTGPGIWGDPPDRNEARAVLRRAVELGVNFIDTADSYAPAPDTGSPTAGLTICGRHAKAACDACGWTRSPCISSIGPTPTCRSKTRSALWSR